MTQPAPEHPRGDRIRISVHYAHLVERLSLPPKKAQCWLRTLLNRYSEPQRHYHTVAHIEAMCALFEAHHKACIEPHAVLLAILFHDVVYNPRRDDNEEASMELFDKFARDVGLAPTLRAHVLQFIEHTKSHAPAGNLHPDLPLFMDLDIEVLSRPAADYARYTQQIRREYAHVPAPVFARVRGQLLRDLLQRPFIFATPSFREAHEAQARRNLTAEVAELDGQL